MTPPKYNTVGNTVSEVTEVDSLGLSSDTRKSGCIFDPGVNLIDKKLFQPTQKFDKVGDNLVVRDNLREVCL